MERIKLNSSLGPKADILTRPGHVRNLGSSTEEEMAQRATLVASKVLSTPPCNGPTTSRRAKGCRISAMRLSGALRKSAFEPGGARL